MKQIIKQSVYIFLSMVLLIVFNNAQENISKEKLRVLFVGNSLTYFNNLPEIVSQLAKSAKQRKFSYKMIAYPDFSLEDHWNKGELQKILVKEKWDYVVMQQGPSASLEGRQILVDYVKKFAEPIAKAGARPALYMVWPAGVRFNDFAGVSLSYSLAAKEVGGLFLPAGEAWLEAWKRDPKLELYGPDMFHPSLTGSYLAALVIYQQLYKKSPLGLPHRLRISVEQEIHLPKDRAEMLQTAAAETNKRYGLE